MRRITKARIKHISLCPKGANKFPVLYKADTNTVELSCLTKAMELFDEKGEILACVYAPEVRDSQGDIASAEVIRDAMHNFAKSGQGIDIIHDGKTLSKDDAFVAESFEIRKDDSRFAGWKDYDGNVVDVSGGWGVVMKIEDKELRKLYRDGEWNGISMGGTGTVEVGKVEDDTADKIIRALARRMNLSISAYGSLDMDAKELEALMTKNNEAVVTGITTGMTKVLTEAGIIKAATPPTNTPAPAPQPKAQDDAPVFKGEPTPENIKKHRLALRKHRAQKDVNWGDDASVDAFEKEMAEISKAEAELNKTNPEGGEDKVEKSDELVAAEAALAKAQEDIQRLSKVSNQPTDDTKPNETAIEKRINTGSSMAKYINEKHGFKS